jgi:putative tryptophan/tyrosine transport system substrate-binding protein
MRRREFIGLAGAAAAWPIAARAQQPVRPVGFLHIASPGPMGHLVAALREGLRESAVLGGADVPIEFRWAEGRYERLRELAEDLISRRVAVIVTGGGESPALAAKAATSTIPIVFNIGVDPVKAGLVASLGRPGGNMTGVNILTAELATKRLGLLHDLLPRGAVIAHLVNPRFDASDTIIRDVAAAGQTMGREIVLLRASNEAEIDAAFAALLQRQVGGLMVAADPVFNAYRDQIVLWSVRLGLPAAYEQREFVQAGGLMSYSTSITDAYRQMGVYVGRILKGEKPSDLPVVQSAKFQLVFNLKTAKTLGLTLPSGLMSIIDEVIE